MVRSWLERHSATLSPVLAGSFLANRQHGNHGSFAWIVVRSALQSSVSEFIPFICVGFIVWGLISSILNEAGGVFTANELFIKQIRLPYTIYVWKFVWSKIIIFAHNFIIYVVILIYFRIWPGEPFIFVIPGLLLIVINGLLVTLYLGMISARFRESPKLSPPRRKWCFS